MQVTGVHVYVSVYVWMIWVCYVCIQMLLNFYYPTYYSQRNIYYIEPMNATFSMGLCK